MTSRSPAWSAPTLIHGTSSRTPTARSAASSTSATPPGSLAASLPSAANRPTCGLWPRANWTASRCTTPSGCGCGITSTATASRTSDEEDREWLCAGCSPAVRRGCRVFQRLPLEDKGGDPCGGLTGVFVLPDHHQQPPGLAQAALRVGVAG